MLSGFACLAIDSDYEHGISREKIRDLYKFRSEKIMLKLLEGDILLTKKRDITMVDLGIGDSNEIIDGTIWTMSKKKKLIEITFNNMLRLTPKGQANAKKLKKMQNMKSKVD